MNFLVERLNASAIYQVAAGLFDESSDRRQGEVIIATANASMDQPEPYELWQSVAIGVMLLILILFTVVGNFFVILAILLERDLRSRPQYYLIFSLAAADLMVGLIVTPLGAWATIQQAWYLGVTLCDFWISIDVLVCTSSILHLVAIALDRYWSITDIYYVQNRTPKRIFFMLMIIWVLSLLISLAPIFGWKDAQFVSRVREQHICLISQQISYQVFSTATAFYIPLCAIIIVYWKIMRAAKKRFRRERDRKTINNRAFDDTAKSKVITVVQKPNMKFESTIQSTSDDERTPMQITDNPTIVNAETQFNKIHSKEKPLSSAKRISIRATGAKRKKRVKESVETRRERKAWRTLAIITGTFVACWTPFFLVSLYRPICGCKIPPVVESQFCLESGDIHYIFNGLPHGFPENYQTSVLCK